MKQEIEIVNLEIKEFIEEEVANITITLLVDKNSHYWDRCNKLCKVGVGLRHYSILKKGILFIVKLWILIQLLKGY